MAYSTLFAPFPKLNIWDNDAADIVRMGLWCCAVKVDNDAALRI